MIVILDDEPQRIHAMLTCLDRKHPQFERIAFDNAPEMNAWLREHVAECELICLDHDLGPTRRRENEGFDPGVGQDVVVLLAEFPPVCPVIVHTTNTIARPGMLSTLADASWRVSYVSPYDDTRWIREVWAAEVQRVLG